VVEAGRAVAGWSMIITSRGVSGVEVGSGVTGLRKGKTPDHNAQRAGGASWTGGGLVARADYEKDNPLYASHELLRRLADPWALNTGTRKNGVCIKCTRNVTDALTLSAMLRCYRRNFDETATFCAIGFTHAVDL